MKKMLIFFLLFFTSCGVARPPDGNPPPPGLLEPVGVTYDTAVAVRGDLSRIKQYRAAVRSYSRGASFGETDLRFKSYHVNLGQNVIQGDVLVELETDVLIKEIKGQEDDIAHLQKTYEHENEMRRFDIEIAERELAEMTMSGADAIDIELKKVSLQKLKLSLVHQQERQHLSIKQSLERCDDSRRLLENTVITAPFDGKVVYMEQISEGESITAFNPLIHIADENRLYVEYSGTEYFSIHKEMEVQVQIGDLMYIVEYEPINIEEQMAYLLQGKTPPARFNFVDSDVNVEPGDFASIYVTTDHRKDVIFIPINALYFDAGENYVYVMADGVREIRTVRTGLRTESDVEIMEGLAEGDEVFVKQ